MNKLKIFFFVLPILVQSAIASAEVREILSIKKALSVVTGGDIVVLDIDNTILRPMQTLGSDQWYGYLVNKYKQSGLSDDHAIHKAIREWLQVQLVTAVQPVEKVTPPLIEAIQAKGIMVIALTARPIDLKFTSADQLSSIEVHFRDYNLSYNDGQEVEFYRGILFVGPKNNKGVVLNQFFKAHNLTAKRLIFVDDKERHVRNMDSVFTPIGITNINFRYGGADAQVKSFNPRISEVQWSHFQCADRDLWTDEETEEFIGAESDQLDDLFYSCTK